MPRLETQVTTTVKNEVKLSPRVRRTLLVNLKEYAALKTQRDAIDHAMVKHKTVVGGILDESGAKSLELEGFRTTIVAPVREVLDEKMLITLGVPPDVIQQAKVKRETTPYVKISQLGVKEDGERA